MSKRKFNHKSIWLLKFVIIKIGHLYFIIFKNQINKNKNPQIFYYPKTKILMMIMGLNIYNYFVENWMSIRKKRWIKYNLLAFISDKHILKIFIPRVSPSSIFPDFCQFSWLFQVFLFFSSRFSFLKTTRTKENERNLFLQLSIQSCMLNRG